VTRIPKHARLPARPTAVDLSYDFERGVIFVFVKGTSAIGSRPRELLAVERGLEIPLRTAQALRRDSGGFENNPETKLKKTPERAYT